MSRCIVLAGALGGAFLFGCSAERLGSSGGGGADRAPEVCDIALPARGEAPFVDGTAAWGLDFRHHPSTGMCDVLDTVGGPGVCAFDYDGDGDADLYFTDRAPYPNRLYRNDGDKLTDVTQASGAGLLDDSHACLAFDHDGDGDLDLFVGNSGADRLLRNVGGVFTDATAEAGLSETGFTTSGTAGDIDGDGDLDLFVGHLVAPETCPTPYCWPSPGSCKPQKNMLFVNNGGVFTEEAAARGITEAEPTLASLFYDADGDGDLDLFVGNDIGLKFPDRLYRNDGTGHFTEVGAVVGLSMPGTSTMGVDIGDADGDGALDVLVSDYKDSPLRLAFCDKSATDCEMVGIGPSSAESVKWSVALEDFDQDMDLDVFTVAGATTVPKGYMGDRHQLYWNDGQQVFTRYNPPEGDVLSGLHLGRGAVFADMDGDLDVDVVVANADGQAQLLLNESARGYGLIISLDTLSAGARVKVSGGGVYRIEQALIGGVYAGSSDPRLHFGLGRACEVDVTVDWPTGESRTVKDVASQQAIRIER